MARDSQLLLGSPMLAFNLSLIAPGPGSLLAKPLPGLHRVGHDRRDLAAAAALFPQLFGVFKNMIFAIYPLFKLEVMGIPVC